MSWYIVLRTQQLTETYFESGTGFQSSLGSATTYATKEASMIDAVTQREAFGAGALLVVKDSVSGTEFAAPNLTPSPYLNQINLSPTAPALTTGQTVQMKALGTKTDSTTNDITNGSVWASATPAHVAVSQTGLLTWVAAGTSVITCSLSGVVSTVTATAS
jgi:Bacterial Ig-like domain (group 2)